MSGQTERTSPRRAQALMIAALAASLMAVAAPAARAEAACDRACLRGVLDRYLSAVVARDPRRAPLAASLKSTENAVLTPPGEGVWKTATGLGALQRRYFDPATGQAAYLGMIQEGAAPALVSVRLKVTGRKITEAEWTIARPEGPGPFAADLLAMPPADTALAPTLRTPRAELVAAANSYFDGLQAHDGSIVRARAGCPRIENGVLTAGPARAGSRPPMMADCHDRLDTMTQISGVAHRRFPLVDEQAGVVLGTGIFHRPPNSMRRDGKPWLRNLLTEYFTVESGRVTGIYAVMRYMDPGDPDVSGWPDQAP